MRKEHALIAKHLERAKEYEELERNGLLVRLPCRVGDIVWSIKRQGIIEEGHVFKVELESVCCRDLPRLWVNIDGIPYFGTDFGKTLFLTREEAEAALKNEEKAES